MGIATASVGAYGAGLSSAVLARAKQLSVSCSGENGGGEPGSVLDEGDSRESEGLVVPMKAATTTPEE